MRVLQGFAWGVLFSTTEFTSLYYIDGYALNEYGFVFYLGISVKYFMFLSTCHCNCIIVWFYHFSGSTWFKGISRKILEKYYLVLL